MKHIKNLFALAAVSVLVLFAATSAHAQAMETKMVGGAAMYPTKNIIENAVNSKDHQTLVAAVKAAGLVNTLQGKGPFTVFAPTDEAFAALPAGTVDNLLKPENKSTLVKVLTYHVVPGRFDSKKLEMEIHAHNGKAMLTTVEGSKIWITKDSQGKWWVIDDHDNKARISIADVYQSNGVIHVIDKVLMP